VAYRYDGFSFVNCVLRKMVRSIRNIISAMRFNEFLQNLVSFIINKYAVFFNLVDKNYKLLQIKLKCWKYVNMIPCYAGDHGDVWKQKMKFGFFFDCACRVFICFANNNRRFRNFYAL